MRPCYLRMARRKLTFLLLLMGFVGIVLLSGVLNFQSVTFQEASSNNDVLSVNQKRVNNLRSWCKRFYLPDPANFHFRRMMVDEKHHIIFCDLAKGGSTSWKFRFANNIINKSVKLPYDQDIHNRTLLNIMFGIKFLYNYDGLAITHRLQNYKKILVVRHPLDRLFSAYYDKLVKNNKYYEQIMGSNILAELRPNASADVIEAGHGVTFTEFLLYFTRHQMVDQHFKSITEMCLPCEFGYDYIGKLETDNFDSHYIINNFLSGFEPEGTKLHSQRGGARNKIYLKEFDVIPTWLKHKIIKTFQDEMDMFGYSVKFEDGKTMLYSTL